MRNAGIGWDETFRGQRTKVQQLFAGETETAVIAAVIVGSYK